MEKTMGSEQVVTQDAKHQAMHQVTHKQDRRDQHGFSDWHIMELWLRMTDLPYEIKKQTKNGVEYDVVHIKIGPVGIAFGFNKDGKVWRG